MDMSEAPKPPPLGADQADLLMAVINVWTALEALKQDLPEPQARSVALATEGIGKAIGSIFARHEMTATLSVDGVVQEPVDE